MIALVCISPEGDYQVEFENFDEDNLQEARNHAASMGSRFHFYPVRVLADADTQLIIEAPEAFEFIVGELYDDIILSKVGDKFKEVCEFVYDYDRPLFVKYLQQQAQEQARPLIGKK